MAGQLISVIRKQPFVFQGANGTSQSVVLGSLIDTSAWKSGVLVVRYVTRTSWASANGTFQVVVRQAMWGADDSDTIYVGTDNLAAPTAIATATAAGTVSNTAFNTGSYALGPYVRVLGLWSQGGDTDSASFSIAVDLLGRDT